VRRQWFQQLAISVLVIASLVENSMSAVAQVSRPSLTNQASYSYTDSVSHNQFQGISTQLKATPIPLTDPLGRILGCGGEVLPDYTGFSVAIYEPNENDPTGTELGKLVPLTRTEYPYIPNNNIPGGKEPNVENSNPYFLTNKEPRGTYNFLLDKNKGQLDPGKTYIFVTNPPSNSIYQQRRIKIQILDSVDNNITQYLATSLDGQPIRTTGDIKVESTVVLVPNAETTGLDLFAFEFTSNLCQPHQVQILKSGDRASAEPGDTVIYRLSVKNLSDVGLDHVVVADNLPLGFNFLPKSVQAEIDGKRISLNTTVNKSIVTFQTDSALVTGKVLNIAYATQLTSDAIRGSGLNSAIVNAQRTDNHFATKDGPATYQLQIRPGIVADCGTIIGRVFVDKNFDGEQQPGEPGIPNAVIYLENGNRITTDANGLFSVANEPPGNHTGVLDLSSIPGYTLAPNRKFKERNSQSRLVRLEPGGLVRMNFAVTPISQERTRR
jgi:uncharacterized repeat protein (TIGR01451 family)